MKQIRYSRAIVTIEIILGVTFLICGCAIYLFYRSKSLYIYHWCQPLCISELIDTCRHSAQRYPVSDFTRFCLPDGLYCTAYILIIDAIWNKDSRLVKFLIIYFVPTIVIGSEFMQYFGVIRGTFDMIDLVCYAIPPLVYYIIYEKTIIRALL